MITNISQQAQHPEFQSVDPVFHYANIAAIIFAAIGIALLLYILISHKTLFSRTSTKIIIGIGIIGIPIVTVSLGILIGMGKAKKVEFCGSCHKAMGSYVQNMVDLNSDSLSAKHFKLRWISQNQCYGCHTDYGLLGDFRAKTKGFIDVIRYYSGIWDGSTIQKKKHFKNRNCLK